MNDLKYFKAFFCLKPSAVKETVILSPIIYPNQFGRVKYHKSVLGYLTVNFKKFTFIKTPMLQSAVADAVVLLAKAPCKKIIFVGAMGGLARGLKIGDVFQTNKAGDVYSVSSIHEETRRKMISLRRKGVKGIDFESRAFFSAARKAKLAATAYYVVTDLPITKPFYLDATVNEKKKIQNSIIQILRVFEP
jgi:purine-nucleoside phosphorylase